MVDGWVGWVGLGLVGLMVGVGLRVGWVYGWLFGVG